MKIEVLYKFGVFFQIRSLMIAFVLILAMLDKGYGKKFSEIFDLCSANLNAKVEIQILQKTLNQTPS